MANIADTLVRGSQEINRMWEEIKLVTGMLVSNLYMDDLKEHWETASSLRALGGSCSVRLCDGAGRRFPGYNRHESFIWHLEVYANPRNQQLMPCLVCNICYPSGTWSVDKFSTANPYYMGEHVQTIHIGLAPLVDVLLEKFPELRRRLQHFFDAVPVPEKVLDSRTNRFLAVGSKSDTK